MSYAIQTEGLCKRYGQALCVDHLDLCVPEGCVYGFMGPNGAGKSTTMKLILGLVQPTAGSIAVLGQPLLEKNRLALLQKTGSLIESPSYYGHLTALENMRLVAELKHADAAQILPLLSLVRLTDAKDKKLRAFSLGMKQRLGIAQALLGNPKLLLLDEPTNGLDPAGIQEMRELVRALPAQRGVTVLVSSHLLGELDQMVSQAGVIDHGKLLFQGPIAALHAHSRAAVCLRVLDAAAAARTLAQQGVACRTAQDGTLLIPALPNDALAALVAALAAQGAGVVGVTERAKTLEEIFLALTGAASAKTASAQEAGEERAAI